jgi:hypothetical protein
VIDVAAVPSASPGGLPSGPRSKPHHRAAGAPLLLESQAIGSGRSRFIAALRAAGVRDRVAVLSPHVSNGAKDIDVMVHSKS